MKDLLTDFERLKDYPIDLKATVYRTRSMHWVKDGNPVATEQGKSILLVQVPRKNGEHTRTYTIALDAAREEDKLLTSLAQDRKVEVRLLSVECVRNTLGPANESDAPSAHFEFACASDGEPGHPVCRKKGTAVELGGSAYMRLPCRYWSANNTTKRKDLHNTSAKQRQTFWQKYLGKNRVLGVRKPPEKNKTPKAVEGVRAFYGSKEDGPLHS